MPRLRRIESIGGGMYGMGDFGWWGWLMMSLGMVVFWGLLAWGALLLLRGRDQTAPADRRPGPKEILDERLARGEIDAVEYRERLAALG
jgi:putative membrane protein